MNRTMNTKSEPSAYNSLGNSSLVAGVTDEQPVHLPTLILIRDRRSSRSLGPTARIWTKPLRPRAKAQREWDVALPGEKAAVFCRAATIMEERYEEIVSG
jgi:hypothetical protein